MVDARRTRKTGSFASSYHGAPRATQDIDIVVSPTANQLRELVKLLPTTEYYVDLDAALDAQRRQGQFNTKKYLATVFTHSIRDYVIP